MEKYVCNICDEEFETIFSLVRHSSKIHNIEPETTYCGYVLNGVKPKCECGCGNETNYISCNQGYSRFIRSHHNRVKGKNNFHKNPLTHTKALATQKENWKLGKYTGWWEKDDEETKLKIEGIKEKLRNNKVRGEKISKALTGVSKSDESKRKLGITQKERYKKDPSIKVVLSEKRLKWMQDNSKVKTSKLEDLFSTILNSLGLVKDIDYIHSHLIVKIKTFFDFYIPIKKMMIEVDGDFYHCNPNTKFSSPEYEIQRKNLINDKRKNSWCKNHEITLLRYWEKDIIERPEWVISDLKKKLGL
jgi:very-short-patch-repair endonuclease